MGIGAQSPAWRKMLFGVFADTWICRRVTTSDGAFRVYVSGGSSLKHLDPRGLRLEEVHARFIEKFVRPDLIVWDLGANVGMFAFPAALRAKGGHVFAFEPDVELAARLLLSQRKNGDLPLSICATALSGQDGAARFQISRYSRAMSKLEAAGQWHDDQVVAAETRTVPTLRIDTLVGSLTPPDVLKIDVEGAEMSVLRGGDETIAKHRPVILIEGPRQIWEELGAFFTRHNYVMFDGGEKSMPRVDQPVWDTIAVPAEKANGGSVA